MKPIPPFRHGPISSSIGCFRPFLCSRKSLRPLSLLLSIHATTGMLDLSTFGRTRHAVKPLLMPALQDRRIARHALSGMIAF